MEKHRLDHVASLIDDLKVEAAGIQALLHEAEECGDMVGKLQYKERLEDIAHELQGFEEQ